MKNQLQVLRNLNRSKRVSSVFFQIRKNINGAEAHKRNGIWTIHRINEPLYFSREDNMKHISQNRKCYSSSSSLSQNYKDAPIELTELYALVHSPMNELSSKKLQEILLKPHEEIFSALPDDWTTRHEYNKALHELWFQCCHYNQEDFLDKLQISPIDVFKNLLRYNIYCCNSHQARYLFVDEWLKYFSGNIDFHPVTYDIECVMYAFYCSSKEHYNFFHQNVTRKPQNSLLLTSFATETKPRHTTKALAVPVTISSSLSNMHEAHAFLENMIQTFYQGNMYLRPLESYNCISYLLTCWCHWAQIISLSQHVHEHFYKIEQKKALTNASNLLRELKLLNGSIPLTNSHDSFLEHISLVQCYHHVILAYLSSLEHNEPVFNEYENETVERVMILLQELKNISTTSSQLDWEQICQVYQKLIHVFYANNQNPQVAESFLHDLIDLYFSIAKNDKLKIPFVFFGNIIQCYYYQDLGYIQKQREIGNIHKILEILQDIELNYIDTITFAEPELQQTNSASLKMLQFLQVIESLLSSPYNSTFKVEKQSSKKHKLYRNQIQILEHLIRFYIKHCILALENMTHVEIKKGSLFDSSTNFHQNSLQKQKLVGLKINQICNQILEYYMKSNNISDAMSFFTFLQMSALPSKILSLNTTTYTIMIQYLPPDDAELIFRQMQDHSKNSEYINANSICYTQLMENYAKHGRSNDVMRLFSELKRNIDSHYLNDNPTNNDYYIDSHVISPLFKAVLKDDKLLLDTDFILELAENIQSSIPTHDKNLFFYSNLITLYKKLKNKDGAIKAFQLLQQMEQNWKDDPVLYPRPDIVCYTNAIHALGTFVHDDIISQKTTTQVFDPVKTAEELYLKILQEYEQTDNPNIKPNIYLKSALLSVYIKHSDDKEQGSLRKALNFFNKDIIQDYLSSSKKKDIDLKPNAICFTMILNALAKQKSSKYNREDFGSSAELLLSYMEQILNNEKELEIQHYTLVIDIWCKSNSPDKAKRAYEILKRMKQHKLTTTTLQSLNMNDSVKNQLRYAYSTLIKSCAHTKKNKKQAIQIANEVMNELRFSGIKPDYISYISYINAIHYLNPSSKDEKKFKYLSNAFQQCCEDGLLHEKVLTIFYYACLDMDKMRDSRQSPLHDNVEESNSFSILTKGLDLVIQRSKLTNRIEVKYGNQPPPFDWVRNITQRIRVDT